MWVEGEEWGNRERNSQQASEIAKIPAPKTTRTSMLSQASRD